MKYYETTEGKLQHGLKWWQRLLGHNMMELDEEYLEFQVYGMAGNALASGFNPPLPIQYYDCDIMNRHPDLEQGHTIYEEYDDMSLDEMTRMVDFLEREYGLEASYV